MRRGRWIVLLGLLLAGTARPDTPLRLWAATSNCFDYVFMSASRGAEGRFILGFNHLSGRTDFARVGEALGPNRVLRHEERRERVFNETTRHEQERRTDQVLLERPDGSTRLLTLGEILPDAGLLACLVDPTSGLWRYARIGEPFELAGLKGTLTAISPEGASVLTPNGVATIPAIGDEARERLLAQWAAAQAAAEAARQTAAAEQAAAATAAAPPARPVVTRRPARTSRLSLGTEYRYPTAFEVLPLSVRGTDGRLHTRAMVIPTRFETRFSGWEIRLAP